MTQTFEERKAALDLAADAEALNRAQAHLGRIRSIVDKFTGNDPSIPTREAISEVYDLLHLIANPNNLVGQGIVDLGPDYPTDHLPSPMLSQLGARGALHPVGVAAGMFGCLSVVNMTSRLLVEDSRIVLPTTWIPSVGDAGNGKTPAAEIAFAPFTEWEEKANHRYFTAMERWANLDKGERKGEPKPINESRIAGDFTMESLVRRLKGNLEAVALVEDELTGLLRAIGQYKKDGGSDRSRMLSLWSGKPWPYQRVGNGEDPVVIYVRQPIVPVFGTIQPEFVGLLGDTGSGMQARWLPHLSGGREGNVTGVTDPEWEATVRVLIDNMDRPRTWTMPGDSVARKEHQKAEDRWEADRRDPSQTSASSSFLAKGGEHALRIALNLAEAGAAARVGQRSGRIEAGEIPEWAVRGGIALVDYCAGVWRALPDAAPGMVRQYADKAVVERDGMLNAWLRGRSEGKATRRDIQRARVGGARTPDDVDALIKRHEAIHGAGSVIYEKAGGVTVYAR